MSCQIVRILTIEVPIQYGPVHVFENEQTEVTALCQYSWSTDSLCWTGWADYKTYETTCKNIESDFYLRIKLFTGFEKVSINGLFTKCYSICLDNSNIFAQNLCSDSVVSIYSNLDCALMMQQQMSDSVICMLGLPIYYFRVTPEVETADFNFKEYVFHNVSSMKYIKMMIPDGQLPSSKPVFTEWDFEWENDWEVELSKTQFAQAFGDTAFPKQRDLIYVPMMKRMYEVNSAYDEKQDGLMWRSTTWKLALVKYNDKINVDKGDFEELIDTLTVNDYDDVFGDLEIEEADRESGVNQTESPKTAANGITNIILQDGTRSKITKDLVRVEKLQLNQKSNIIARNMYFPIIGREDPYIEYQDKMCYCDFSLSFIIKTMKKQKENFKHTIIGLGSFEIEFDNENNLYFGGTQTELTEDSVFMIHIIISRDKFKGDVYISEYSYDKRMNRPMYMVPDTMKFFDFTSADNISFNYNNEWNCTGKKENIWMSPKNCGLTNLKVYNRPIELPELMKESTAYVTTHKDMIINDLARPLNDGWGFDVKF